MFFSNEAGKILSPLDISVLILYDCPFFICSFLRNVTDERRLFSFENNLTINRIFKLKFEDEKKWLKKTNILNSCDSCCQLATAPFFVLGFFPKCSIWNLTLLHSFFNLYYCCQLINRISGSCEYIFSSIKKQATFYNGFEVRFDLTIWRIYHFKISQTIPLLYDFVRGPFFPHVYCILIMSTSTL